MGDDPTEPDTTSGDPTPPPAPAAATAPVSPWTSSTVALIALIALVVGVVGGIGVGAAIDDDSPWGDHNEHAPAPMPWRDQPDGGYPIEGPGWRPEERPVPGWREEGAMGSEQPDSSGRGDTTERSGEIGDIDGLDDLEALIDGLFPGRSPETPPERAPEMPPRN